MAGDSVTYEYPPVYKDSHLVVRDHLNEDETDERVAVYVGMEPMTTTPTIVDARRLRDALDGYLDDDTDDTDEFDRVVTVKAEADTSAARESIEELQLDVDALTADINAAVERLNELGVGDVDYGLPAPSPGDVNARVAETPDTDPRE